MNAWAIRRLPRIEGGDPGMTIARLRGVEIRITGGTDEERDVAVQAAISAVDNMRAKREAQ